MEGKAEFAITGTVTTILRDGETKDQAQNRVAGNVLDMEIQGNAQGDPRFHLSLEEGPLRPKLTAAKGQKVRLAADPDTKGTYYLVGVDYESLTTANEKALIDLVNKWLREKEGE